MSRRKVDRWQQILDWLVSEFPPPFPVKLVFERPEGAVAECYELEGGRERCVYIALDPRRLWTDGVQDLLHEYAHALTWPISERQFDVVIEHPATFWAAYGEIYTAFFDGEGQARSLEF